MWHEWGGPIGYLLLDGPFFFFLMDLLLRQGRL